MVIDDILDHLNHEGYRGDEISIKLNYEKLTITRYVRFKWDKETNKYVQT